MIALKFNTKRKCKEREKREGREKIMRWRLR